MRRRSPSDPPVQISFMVQRDRFDNGNVLVERMIGFYEMCQGQQRQPEQQRHLGQQRQPEQQWQPEQQRQPGQQWQPEQQHQMIQDHHNVDDDIKGSDTDVVDVLEDALLSSSSFTQQTSQDAKLQLGSHSGAQSCIRPGYESCQSGHEQLCRPDMHARYQYDELRVQHEQLHLKVDQLQCQVDEVQRQTVQMNRQRSQMLKQPERARKVIFAHLADKMIREPLTPGRIQKSKESMQRLLEIRCASTPHLHGNISTSSTAQQPSHPSRMSSALQNAGKAMSGWQ